MTEGRASPTAIVRLSRRRALATLAGAAMGPLSVDALAAPPGNTRAKAHPRPKDNAYEVLEVGPGKRFPSLTRAGAFMNSVERWNNSYTPPDRIARMRFRVIVSPGPPGYYVNDSGTHSRRWREPIGWPPYEGILYGPVIVEGEAGKPPPVLETDGFGDGVLYYQKGLFCTGEFDATFRRLVFRGFRRKDGGGNYAGVRLGDAYLKGVPMSSRVLIEDCEFTGCDNGVMGGAPGQSVTIRRSHFHHNGNATGTVHNIYVGTLDQLLVEDLLSTDCVIGHLLKSRAARTVIRNSRLLGGGGTESYCLDAPNAGVLEIENLVCEKSLASDNASMIHYSGENQDAHGAGFHKVSSIRIRNLTLIAPRRRRGPGPVYGFTNHSGLGAERSGQGSRLIPADAQGVQAFGLNPRAVGLPCRILASPPAVDRRPPRIA